VDGLIREGKTTGGSWRNTSEVERIDVADMGRSSAAPVHLPVVEDSGVDMLLLRGTKTQAGRRRYRRGKLVADYGDFGGGDFETLEAVVFIEIEHDFEVGSGDAQAVVGFAVGGGDAAGGLDGD